MNNPDLNDLLELLEEARDSGTPISPEEVCGDWPELLSPLKERWARLQQFNDNYGTDDGFTRRENTSEIEHKLSAMPESLAGARLVTQSELQIEEFHDRGGLGDVYRATDSELSREVAVKMLRTDRRLPTNIQDFKRESQIIGGLVHPGIVSIFGQGETIDGRPFYSMPFLDRGNLRSSVAQYHRRHATRVVEQDKEYRDLIYRLVNVCKTLAYAHSRGIVHRDLKTENVILGKYGETLVIDWGCATSVDRDERFKVYGERTLQLKGINDSSSSSGLTLRYASPEQLHGNKFVGPESDIYGLGAMLYFILTGRSPLEDVPDEQVRRTAMSGKVPSPETLKPGVPRRLAAICRKAMSLDPSDRYETALDMAEDLERYLSDETVSVCKDSMGLRMARVVRRNRTASMVLLGTLVVGAGLLSLAFAGQSFFALRAEASAKERLRMAAKFAGNIGGFEINRRITLLEQHALNPKLVEAMVAIEAEPTKRELWETAQKLVYLFRDELEAAGCRVESMSLTDAKGNQIARAPYSDDSVGKNYAYRNYFHGGAEDLDPESEEYLNSPPQPSTKTIISNAYVSTNTDKSGKFPVKTSFTVPVNTTDEEGGKRLIGRIGISIEINDLAIFAPIADSSIEAVLVETKDYTWGNGKASGLILDRLTGDDKHVGVPTATSNRSAKELELAVKDSMPRLNDASITKVLAMLAETNDSFLIPSFNDENVSTTTQDAACAKLRIPYRDDLDTGWTVIFIESASARESEARE